eukprot:1193574-Prorocentrum_minimum.AAC.2
MAYALTRGLSGATAHSIRGRRRGGGGVLHAGVHQSQKGRENILIAGTNRRRGERIYACAAETYLPILELRAFAI